MTERNILCDKIVLFKNTSIFSNPHHNNQLTCDFVYTLHSFKAISVSRCMFGLQLIKAV